VTPSEDLGELLETIEYIIPAAKILNIPMKSIPKYIQNQEDPDTLDIPLNGTFKLGDKIFPLKYNMIIDKVKKFNGADTFDIRPGNFLNPIFGRISINSGKFSFEGNTNTFELNTNFLDLRNQNMVLQGKIDKFNNNITGKWSMHYNKNDIDLIGGADNTDNPLWEIFGENSGKGATEKSLDGDFCLHGPICDTIEKCVDLRQNLASFIGKLATGVDPIGGKSDLEKKCAKTPDLVSDIMNYLDEGETSEL
jgi:hypothetical protein